MATDYSKLSAARIQKLAKNPGTRSKIPDKYLPAQYKAVRAQNAYNNAPVTPGSSYTNKMAGQETQAASVQKYGEADKTLNDQLQRSQGVQSQIPGWYQQYRDVLNAQQQGQAAGYAAAAQQYQALQAGIQAPAAQGTQQIGDLQGELQKLGGVSDLGATQVAANAAAQRGAYAGDMGSVVAAQGANNAAYGAAQVGASGKSQLEALQKELDQERQVRDSQTSLAKEKGAFNVTNRQAITDRERKQLLENKAFDLDVTNTLQDNQTALTNSQTQRINARTQRANADRSAAEAGQKLNKYGFTTAQWNAMAPLEQNKWRTGAYSRTAAGKKQVAPRQEPASSLSIRRNINARSEMVKQYAKQHGYRLDSRDGRAQLVAALRQDHSGYFANPNEEKSLSAAIDLANGGPIGSSTLQYLRRQGVFITTDGRYAGRVNH